MNCDKCGNTAMAAVGVSKIFNVCGVCLKLHRQMCESLRLEYVEKLKESEIYFFNGGKETEGSIIQTGFFDDEEMYPERKTEPQVETPEVIEDSLPQELFG